MGGRLRDIGRRGFGRRRLALRLETFPECFWGPAYYAATRGSETAHGVPGDPVSRTVAARRYLAKLRVRPSVR